MNAFSQRTAVARFAAAALLLSVLAFASTVAAGEMVSIVSQKVADAARWVWSEEAANPFFCMMHQAGDYGVCLSREPRETTS